MDADGRPATGPETLREIVGWARESARRCRLDGPFEIVVNGSTPAGDPVAAAAIARAHESCRGDVVDGGRLDGHVLDALRARILAGPPRE